MKQFIEFIPLIVFFAVYKFYDIYMATGALVEWRSETREARDARIGH